MIRVEALLLLLPASLGELTNCQKCCAPGGDCSKAFKGGPGKCCGVVSGQSFCCPGSPGPSDTAKCYNCGANFRCYSAKSRPGANICGLNSPFAPKSRLVRQQSYSRPQPPREHGGGDMEGFLLIMLIAVAIPVACWFCRCSSSSHSGFRYADEDVYHGGAQCKPVAFGQPVGHGGGGCVPPHCSAPCGYHGYHGQDYGYSGGAVAGGAAAGFVGGMLVGQAMGHGHGDHQEVHHYHHSDGGGYQGYDGGGHDDGDDDGFDADF